jgi:hypothetical protein
MGILDRIEIGDHRTLLAAGRVGDDELEGAVLGSGYAR